MTRVVCIYVPKTGLGNLEIGLNRLVWGLTDANAARSNNQSTLDTLRPGMPMVFAAGGPSPRVPTGGWGDATFSRVVTAATESGLYESNSVVWPDDHYPNRWAFGVASDTGHRASSHHVSPPIAEALRMSANKQGAPVIAVVTGEDALAVPIVSENAELDDPIRPEGSTDGWSLQIVRLEQRGLKRREFDTRGPTCAICGAEFPRELLRLAHIKKRSACTDEERLRQDNVMLACTVNGCDDLFERGYLSISDDGLVVTVNHVDGSTDLVDRLTWLRGRRWLGDMDAASEFIGWHRASSYRG
jgi:hypothetical protein